MGWRQRFVCRRYWKCGRTMKQKRRDGGKETTMGEREMTWEWNGSNEWKGERK